MADYYTNGDWGLGQLLRRVAEEAPEMRVRFTTSNKTEEYGITRFYELCQQVLTDGLC